MNTTETEPYQVDDRGNVAQFYCTKSWEIIATLDRESGPTSNQYTWDGDADVTAWAKTHGYPDIETITRVA
jgi:hypothetical protein